MTGTILTGLSSAEVEQRRHLGQVNRVRRSDAAEYRDIVFRNLFTLFNALVVPAAIALFLLEEYPGAIAVSGMASINTVIGLVQEIRAKQHLDQLTLLVETRARVVHVGAPAVAEVLPAAYRRDGPWQPLGGSGHGLGLRPPLGRRP